jgi:hypothetical protein
MEGFERILREEDSAAFLAAVDAFDKKYEDRVESNARLMERDRRATEELEIMRVIQEFTTVMNELHKTVDTHLLDGLRKEMKSIVEVTRRLEHELSITKSQKSKSRDGPVEPNEVANG